MQFLKNTSAEHGCYPRKREMTNPVRTDEHRGGRFRQHYLAFLTGRLPRLAFAGSVDVPETGLGVNWVTLL
jgi:hypothetical protein